MRKAEIFFSQNFDDKKMMELLVFNNLWNI